MVKLHCLKLLYEYAVKRAFWVYMSMSAIIYGSIQWLHYVIIHDWAPSVIKINNNDQLFSPPVIPAVVLRRPELPNKGPRRRASNPSGDKSSTDCPVNRTYSPRVAIGMFWSYKSIKISRFHQDRGGSWLENRGYDWQFANFSILDVNQWKQKCLICHAHPVRNLFSIDALNFHQVISLNNSIAFCIYKIKCYWSKACFS